MEEVVQGQVKCYCPEITFKFIYNNFVKSHRPCSRTSSCHCHRLHLLRLLSFRRRLRRGSCASSKTTQIVLRRKLICKGNKKEKKRARILLNLYIVVPADLDSRLLIIRRSVLLATAAFPHHFVSKTLNEDLKLSFDTL